MCSNSCNLNIYYVYIPIGQSYAILPVFRDKQTFF